MRCARYGVREGKARVCSTSSSLDDPIDRRARALAHPEFIMSVEAPCRCVEVGYVRCTAQGGRGLGGAWQVLTERVSQSAVS